MLSEGVCECLLRFCFASVCFLLVCVFVGVCVLSVGVCGLCCFVVSVGVSFLLV